MATRLLDQTKGCRQILIERPANETAVSADLVSLEANTPIAWRIVGTVGGAEADLLSHLAGKPRRSLGTVVQGEMRGWTWPNPARAGLREHFHHDDLGGFIRYLEGNHALGQT